MKIIYLHQYFKRPEENGGTRSYDLAIALKSKGYVVEVVTTTSSIDGFEDRKVWKVEDVDGVRVHYLFLPYDNSFSFTKRAFVFTKFLWYSFQKALSIQGDVVLATSTPLTIGIPALLKKLFHKTPYIFEVRDVWPEAVIAIGAIKSKPLKKVLYALEKLIYKHSEAIVPLSTDMQSSIVSRYPQFANKTEIVIENIAKISRFQINAEPVDLEAIIGFKPRFSILYAGTFGRVNGIHKVVDLAKKTLEIDDGLVYILIGSGAEKEDVRRLAINKGVLNKNFFILDSISKKELPLWYNAVSMGSSFVIDIPELWANSANKFFDTLAAGRPVLINYDGWQADVIRFRNVGYVLPIEITDRAALEFIDYSRNDTLIDVQRQFALELAREKYSLEEATRKYLAVFEKIEKKYVQTLL